MPETDLELLRAAAKEAGEIALSFFRKNPKKWEKSNDAGPVTEADLAVNEHLQSTLRAARPAYGWLSEETDDDAARFGTSRQFVIDPIDGTRAFIEGSENWAHSLAIVEDGVPVAAAVELPKKGLSFWASQNNGAYLNGKELSVTDVQDFDRATVLTAKPNLASSYWKFGKRPEFNTAFRSSLAYRMCLVASGRMDAMLTLRPTWEWDIAAGSLIVREAGGVAIDQSGEDVKFNNKIPQTQGVIAGGEIASKIASCLA